MTDALDLSLPEAEAHSLTEVGVLLDQARQNRNAGAIASALDRNLQVWTAMKTVALRQDVMIPDLVRANLIRLAEFVAATTMKDGVNISDETINTLININFQISEGLLEGQRARQG
ncbi:MAG: flagellar biosynthesis regulator FlaF [Actinomycetota bacterium]